MGTIGAIMLVVSVILFVTAVQSPLFIVLYVIAVGASVIALIRYTLRKIPRTKPEYSIYSNKDQEGYRASSYDQTAIGKTGVVVADLKPGGYIRIEGKKHQAISTSGYITQGSEVVVIGGQEESLIVKVKQE